MIHPDDYVELRDRIAALSAKATTMRLAKAADKALRPPDGVRSAAARGLALREKWKRGGITNSEASSQGIGSGVQRAVNLKNGDAISLDTIRRMHAFFSRHAKNYRPDEKEKDGGPTAGTVAWLLWGGNAGKAWAASVLADVEKAAPNTGWTPRTGYDHDDGKSEEMPLAKEGDGGAPAGNAAPGPAGGPDAGDVHVPTTERLARRIRRLKERIDKAIARYPAGHPKGGQFKPKNDGALASAPEPGGIPAPPKFITSNAAAKRENEGHAKAMHALASKGDIDGLKAYKGFSEQSKKLAEYKQQLIDAVGTSKPKATKPLPDFKAALVGENNTNAASHNAKVLLIEQYAKAGDADKILGMGFGVNTYGKRQAKLANETLGALGSEHKVAPGQKAGTHAALGGTKPPAPAPAPAPKPAPAPAPAPALAPSPAPAPAPAAGKAEYKPAKKLDDAIAQLESYGMKVTRLNAYSQSKWAKEMIDKAPPEKKALAEKMYAPKKVSGVLTDNSYLAVLNAIGPEAARLANEFPALLSAVNITQRTPGPKALGMFMLVSKTICLRTPSGFKPPKPPKPGEVPWTVSSGGHSSAEIHDTFRHEAGHALDIGKNGAAITKALAEASKSVATSMGWKGIENSGSMALKKYASTHSKYGGKDSVEATAELVALYTMKGYKPGTIAKPLEQVLDKYLKKSPVAKARDDDMQLDSDFVSINIPEPPDGYEFISASGVDIQFRDPSGKTVQYVDMVNAGLFGPIEEEE